MMKRVPLCRQGEDDSSIVIYHGALVIEVQLQLLFLTHVGLKHSGTIMIILIIAPTLRTLEHAREVESIFFQAVTQRPFNQSNSCLHFYIGHLLHTDEQYIGM